MNQYYEKIMLLKEADEFKNIVNKWEFLSNNIKKCPTNAAVLLPDMLWIAKSGVGKTNLLRLMSEYLFVKGNLMDFYGDVKFFEFLLGYCSPNETFSELQRLMDEVSNAAGFRSEYKGIVHIDVDEWVEHYEEKHFISLMEYLSSNSDKWLIVLSVSCDQSDKLQEFEAFVSMYLRLEIISLTLPNTFDLFDIIEQNLNDYGLSLQEDAKDLLMDTINALRNNKYFDGFKTINMLCQDIVYSVFSSKNFDKYVVDREMLVKYSKDSDYIKRMLFNIEKVNTIGFLGR